MSSDRYCGVNKNIHMFAICMHLIFNSTEKIVFFLVKLKINFLYIRANWTQNQTVKNPCQYIPKSNPKLFGFNLWLVPEIHLWWLNLNRDQQTDEHPAVFLGCLAHQITEIGKKICWPGQKNSSSELNQFHGFFVGYFLLLNARA